MSIAFLTLAGASTLRAIEVGWMDKNLALTLARLARLRADQPIAMARCARFRRRIRHTTVLSGRRAYGCRGVTFYVSVTSSRAESIIRGLSAQSDRR
jgi:hypothetical protein